MAFSDLLRNNVCRVNESGRKEPDLLAERERVLEARLAFDCALHDKKSRVFPQDQFGLLWDAVRAYCVAMKGRDWIHRSVARELRGVREYLQLEGLRLLGDVLSRVDRMECLIFSDDDSYFVGLEPAEDEAQDLVGRRRF